MIYYIWYMIRYVFPYDKTWLYFGRTFDASAGGHRDNVAPAARKQHNIDVAKEHFCIPLGVSSRKW